MWIAILAAITTPLLTLGLLAATIVLAYATVTLARETRKMRETPGDAKTKHSNRKEPRSLRHVESCVAK